MFSAERFKVIPVAKAIDLSSTVYTDNIYCKDLVGKVTFIFMLNTLGGASSTLTVTSAAADAAYTTPIRFNYAFGGAAMGTATAGSATSCDVLAAWTSAVTLTLTYGTYSNFMLVVDVDLADMDASLDHDWLACVFTTTSSVTGTVNGVAIGEYRYPGQGSATVLATA
jgi:hypothetical protein